MAPVPSTTGTIRSSTDATFDASGTAVTFSFDAGSDADRFLLISVSWDGASAHTLGDSAVTYNSVALTALGATTSQSSARKRTYGLIAPATGSNTVSVDPSAGIGSEDAVIEVYCYSGVDQTTPYDGYATANATDGSAPYESAVTVTSATGDLAWVSHMVRAASVTGGTSTGFTERLDNVASNIGAVSGDQTGAASVVTSVAWAGVVSIDYIAHGFNLNAATPAGPDPDSVAPSTGDVAGGEAVTITGTGFDASGGASEGVTFGGVAATSVVFVNPTTITCVTPAHAAGAVDVVVTNGDGTSGTLVNGFTYTVGPVVTTPMGPTNGSGVLPTGTLTSDAPLNGTPGAYLELAFTSPRGTLYVACLPETP